MSNRNHRRSAGFTLVELMIALMISGLVITTMYAVGSASSRHFQVQHQAAAMQSSLRFAMLQVKRDLMRAGYLATPLDARDQCTPTGMSSSIQSGGDGWIAGVSSFRNDLIPNLVDPTGNNAANGFVHDEITLIGNYATSNEYPGIEMVGSNTLRLDINPLTTWHSITEDFGWDAAELASTFIDQTRVQRAFPTGGLIRIQTTTGRRHYATINGPAQVVGNFITLSFTPGMPNACMSDADGGWVAPLQVVRYGANLSAVNTIESERATGAAGQIAQLVRTQRQPANKNLIMPGTAPRAVLDYLAAFDLSFTMTPATGLNNPDNYVIGGVGTPNNTNNPAAVNADPELIRAISVTLAVRAPSTDPGMRFFNCQNLRCFQLVAASGPGGAAARVRVLRSEVFLPNVAYEGYR